MITNNITATDRFSWQRVKMVAHFYYPCLRMPLLLYPAVSAVVGILNAWLTQSMLGLIFSALPALLLSFMFYLFPLFLTRPQSPTVETMLPATSAEKATFFAIACLVVNPFLVYIPNYVCSLIATLFTNNELSIQIQSLTTEITGSSYGFNTLSALPPLATCMYVVLSRWGNRIGSAIGYTIAAIITITVLGAIGGIFIALNELPSFTDNINSGFDIDSSTLALEYKLAPSLRAFEIAIGAISLAYTALITALTYRKIRTLEV